MVADGLGYVEDVSGHPVMRTHGVAVGLFGVGIIVDVSTRQNSAACKQASGQALSL